MRRGFLVCVALLIATTAAHAQKPPDHELWSQYVRDSLPGVPGGLWNYKIVTPLHTRISLETSGRSRLSLTVRLGENRCLDPSLDFEDPPSLGTTKIRGLSVGYRKGAAPTLSTVDACGTLVSGGKTLYLRVTGILDPKRDRELFEQAIAAIYDAAEGAPKLVDWAMAGDTGASSAAKSQASKLEAELAAMMREKGGVAAVNARVGALNAEARRKPTVSESEDVGNVTFASVGWRTWLSSPSRVPKLERADDETPDGFFDGLAQSFSLNIGAIRNHVYFGGSADIYRGDVAEGTNPGVYQLMVGFGAAERSWSKGGVSTITSYSHETLNRYGQPCTKVNFDQDDALVESELRSRRAEGCGEKVRVTESKTRIDIPPGWVVGWAGVYGGWRYVTDMLGGESGDEMRPLNDGGGPIVGGAFFVRRMGLALEFSGDVGYYVHGWDDHGKLAYNGRVGFGSILAMMDLRWRLDSATGKEFMFGIQFRADLFEKVGFWDK